MSLEDFPQFPYTVENFKLMLKVSLEETPSTKEKRKFYLLISITCYTTKCLKFITCIHYNQYFDIQSKTNENK